MPNKQMLDRNYF